ncbi:MAG: sulfotransferase family 2 domain-containing protein [bacterium]
MIVSFRHRFIFVAIPKTATHALRAALRPHLDTRDWEQCGLFEQRRFPVVALAEIGHGHITCRELYPFLLPDVWESCFRFCIVRDPCERFVSYCRFMNRDNGRMRDDPIGTMKRTLAWAADGQHVLFRPQHEFVTDEDGGLMVNYVGRVEALQMHFDRICETIGLPAAPLDRVNVSGSSAYRDCLDQELTEMVQAHYARDFALFDYPPATSQVA